MAEFYRESRDEGAPRALILRRLVPRLTVFVAVFFRAGAGGPLGRVAEIRRERDPARGREHDEIVQPREVVVPLVGFEVVPPEAATPGQDAERAHQVELACDVREVVALVVVLEDAEAEWLARLRGL